MDSQRLEQMRAAMAVEGLDALVCRLPENVVMLSGHWPLIGWSFLLFPREGTPLIVVPHCDEREARAELWDAECASFLFGVLAGGDPYASIAKELKRSTVGKGRMRIGFEGGFETVAPPWNAAEPAIPAAATRALLEEVFGADALVDATDLLMMQRAYKTSAEQEQLRRVNEISAFGLEVFMRDVDVGVSGIDMVTAVESAIVKRGTGYKGARCVRAFAQVSTGLADTAIAYRPMVVTTNRPLESGEPALLELAVVADGFWSDRTRVRVAGESSAVQRAALDTVRTAQAAAIAAVKPGVTTGEVDAAARDIIHAAGYSDEEFLHVTGHGLGLRYHEPTPLICPGGETVLEEGMVHTVEPGIYRADFGGFRIEDNIIVTADGGEVMGPQPVLVTGAAS
ncbi:MAG: Xaa-Pro dipeptidase [Myxococcota bacterium]|jgi:Xaa-Pro dipeptidase